MQTQNGQIENREGQFAEFDKKCIGLESWTVPLNESRTYDTNFYTIISIDDININHIIWLNLNF